MSDQLLWAFGLLAVAAILFLIEVLVPSGGIIGLVAIATALGAVVAFSFESPIWGGLSLAGLLIMVPLCFNFALKVFPNTPIGKRLILGEDEDDEEELARLEAARRIEQERKRALLGAEGVTTTAMRPVGSVNIDGVTLEASSEIGMLEAGVKVRVTRLDGFVVKVRPV